MTVQPGAVVSRGAATPTIFLGSDNYMANNGTVITSDSSGISVDSNNVVNNAGVIIGGANSNGIYTAGLDNTIINSGQIVVGNTSLGIAAQRSTVSNTGVVTVGDGSFGILSVSLTGPAVFNSGTIATGAGSRGVYLISGFSRLDNAGVISVGAGSSGVELAAGLENTVFNSGLIKAGANGTSIHANAGGQHSVVNSGTLDGRISLNFPANTVSNSGLITITDAERQSAPAIRSEGCCLKPRAVRWRFASPIPANATR